jgi:putative membrane protein
MHTEPNFPMPASPAHSLTRPVPDNVLPLTLLAIYAAEWLALAIAPLDRGDWLLENLLPLLALPALIWIHRHRALSRLSYISIFIFMALHAVGAHYTYAKVPYDAWFQALSGHSLDGLLGLQRNGFDRLVHFLYGLLWFPLCWELLAPAIDPRQKALRYLLVAAFLSSHAGIYEAIEWVAAELVGGDLGTAYLGTQGDVWDAQKDMAMAFAGTLLAVVIVWLCDLRPARPR